VSTRRGPHGGVIVALIACFAAGGVVGWWLHAGAPAPAISHASESARGAGRQGDGAPSRQSANGAVVRAAPAAAPESRVTSGAVATSGRRSSIDDLHGRDLRVPIDGVNLESIKGGFAERRDSGGRPHEAVDMLAPRNTPVHAVEDGTIAKLFFSKAGGNTIYQYDPSGRFCYYYAHLERYADRLRDGDRVSRGDVIGFVGTSGNAPPNTPHLHFAVFELTADRHWWQGQAIDPYLVFTGTQAAGR
jgi:peptidoglycan LD-endopeptidase LytH